MSRAKILSISLLTLCIGCGGSAHTPGDKAYTASVQPSVRAPTDSMEQSILDQLSTLSPEQAVQIEGHSVLAHAPYSAASGSTCRQIDVTGPQDRTLLVCLLAQGWSYVPQIFPMGAEPK